MNKLKLLPKKPSRGLKLHFTCINCDREDIWPITSVRKNSENPDGSTCYVIKFHCGHCDYSNGEYRPIWYNIGQQGEIQGGGVRLDKTHR